MMEEAKENDHGVTSPSLPSLALPRSPLISIPNPSQTPKSAQTTPKSAHSRASCYRRLSELPPLTESRGGAREKGCARRILDSCNLSKSLSSVEELVQVPCFELNEDPSFWKDRNVQVLIRIRPIGASESTIHGHKRCISQESSQSLTWIGNPETRFTFDHVASESISQEKLFRAVGVPMVENCMSGYNGCMFAYGQTGSGKTYTMMGELREVENCPSEDRGMTPRIFEYLFARIKEEEEKRNEEKLKYNCRCSFLEIYNEQITDLLEPSSSNLQLREDMEKGVYVEGLKECEASSVSDIMALLLQGVANRRIAATKMNSESSRSHSVFTCIIESQWEKDSLSHLRFSRLNLVDLAGSERQKSSGAEGERLKEAANINRSLSTLGLVIMSLVDIANGKSRHVPYRDSRLTFLLQDSLGGNSKTIVLSTVSPSICSSSETLSTLKFAQRAKLIQNNAKVNEDSSGDVIALQRQIQILKDQLRSSKTHHEISTNSINPSLSFKPDNLGSTSDEFGDSSNNSIHLNQKVIDLEAALSSSMRRERMCEMEIKRLEGEIKHMGRLVHLIEDDAHRTKERQKISEEKIRRMELLADDLIYSEGYLMEDNVSLKKELELVQNQVDKNPQVEKFALENMRLIEQIKSFENYHQFGEREILLTEISQLRNQLFHIFEGKYLPNNITNTETNGLKSSETITISDQEICTNNLEDQIKSLTEENQKLLEAIASRDLEWETAIFDLTKFLSEGYDSLEEASQSIENVMSLFPKRGVEDFSMVNGFVERAIRVNLEREKLVNELRAKLDDARRIERDLKGKLNCLRGATLAFTELHERESDERSKEILDLKRSSSNEEILVPIESNSKVRLEEVNQKIEKHEKDTKNLLFQFEKAQETMQEAELMLSTLLHSTETARGERDSLIKSHVLSLEETNQLVSSIEDSFHQIKCEVAKEMNGIQSETASFVYEVKDWIEKLRVFCANLPLTREFERKNEIVEGLFFDLRLLQESTSYRRDVNEKNKQIGASLKNLQEELNAKTSLVEKMTERQEFLETELSISRYELERMQQLCSVYEKENNEFKIILKEEELKNSEIEACLQDKCVLIEGLEREILSKNGNSETKCMLSSRNLEREIERVSQERAKFEREVISLKTKLEMAMALAEEREAISVEAQQIAEMSKMYVEEKEEEVKVLEHSIEELEATIDVLEGKARDLKEEIESYQYVTRNKELYEAQKYVEDLETEVEYRDEEINQYKDHISELVLHSEAQSSLFTEKFKALEEMALSARARNEASGSNNESNNGEITEKSSARTRGSGSPFKCMSSLVHQIGMEKDKELSKSRQRIQELEALLSTKQQEICILSARLAAVDTMTHDVIRDLLGVKLDMNNYANMLDQEQLENLLVKSHQQAEESKAKDEEILNLRNKIDQLYDEKESLIEDVNQIKAEILESQMIVEGLEQRENLLTTKNKILKMDKVNLHKKILERDEIIESMASSNGNKKEEGSARNGGIEEFRKRLEQSDKLLSHARQEKYISRKS